MSGCLLLSGNNHSSVCKTVENPISNYIPSLANTTITNTTHGRCSININYIQNSAEGTVETVCLEGNSFGSERGSTIISEVQKM